MERSFETQLENLRAGTLIDFLRDDHFRDWCELASSELLGNELSRLIKGADAVAIRRFAPVQIETVARRVIFSRDLSLFDSLRPVWRAFGESNQRCDNLNAALRMSLDGWRGGVFELCSPVGFSRGHARFVQALHSSVDKIAKAVFANSIANSRLKHERRHVGFPVVLTGLKHANLRQTLWVHPKSDGRAATAELQRSWKAVWATVLRTLASGANHNSRTAPKPVLPDWLSDLADCAGFEVETLESAGLSLLMQGLAELQNRPLPFGIGFTGRWQGDELRGVTGLAAKLQAAREAGIFLLLACRDPNELEPAPVDGVKLMLLPEHMELTDIIREVNRVSAETGLTEYRWRVASEKLLGASALPSMHSRDLPKACDSDSCPWGFVGRKNVLSQLDLRRRTVDSQSGRKIVAIVAPPRSGKTTLLSQWGFRGESEAWPS